MYLSDQQLGIDPVSAFTTAAIFKNIFGIGKKKRAFKSMEGQNAGAWTSQFPPDWDWKEYLNKFNGAVKSRYDLERKRKDSMLLKQGIATPEDFAAWHFSEYGADYTADNKNWIPKRKDGTRVDQPPKAAPKAKPPSPQSIAQSTNPPKNFHPSETAPDGRPPTYYPPDDGPLTVLNPQGAPIVTPPIATNPFTSLFATQTPVVPQAAPSSAATPSWLIPALIAGGIGVGFLILNKKKRR